MSSVRLFPALQRLLDKAPFACAALAVLATVSFAAEVPSNTAEIHFGGTTVTVDSSLILGVGGVAKSLLGTRRKFDVPADTPVQVALPPEVLASFSPPCESITSILMIHGSLPPRADNPLYAGLQPHKTMFEGISKLEPTTGRPLLELYQFDSDRLRDFWGDQINFYKSGTLVRLKVQITRDLRIELGTLAKGCFFERGEIFVSQLRGFIFSTIKSH